MNSPTKKKGFFLFGYAKKLEGLASAEKAAIVCVCDAIGQIGGYCTKSLPNMAREHGHEERTLQRGLHGRKVKNGDSAYPGIVARGLIYADGPTKGGLKGYQTGQPGKGQTNCWRLNIEVFLTFLPRKEAEKLQRYLQPDLPDKGDHRGDHMGEHNGDRKGAIVVTQPPKESLPPDFLSPEGLPPEESSHNLTSSSSSQETDEGDDGGSLVNPSADKPQLNGQDQVKTLSDIYYEDVRQIFSVGQREGIRLQELIHQHGFETVRELLGILTGSDSNFTPDHPAAFFISRFDELLAAKKAEEQQELARQERRKALRTSQKAPANQ